jgi:hypothetical protein
MVSVGSFEKGAPSRQAKSSKSSGFHRQPSRSKTNSRGDLIEVPELCFFFCFLFFFDVDPDDETFPFLAAANFTISPA